VLSFGLFLLVINAGMILLVSRIIPGFQVAGFTPALLAAVITGLTSWAAHTLLGDLRRLGSGKG